jgi:catechol 2,3-dioxygenase-like lactoylglutathione lyase family enzyme
MTETNELVALAPELFVDSVPGSVRFYVEKLGFEVVRQDPGFAVVALGEAIVMFEQRAAHPRIDSPGGAAGAKSFPLHLRFMVDDVDAFYERVRSDGVEVVLPIASRDYGLRDFIIADPDGFPLRFAARI